MIEMEGDQLILYCDICGEASVSEGFGWRFLKDVGFVRKNGWISKLETRDGKWYDICPGCQDEEN